VIESFHSDIRVHRSGTVDVAETIRVRFTGSYNGIFREIPVQYRTRADLNYTLRLEVKGVEDGSGRPLRHEVSRSGHYRKIKIWVPGASDTTRTIVIRYRARNALRFFEEDDVEWDELYWNVTGDEWPVGIETSGARVRLPAIVTGVRARAFTGAYGSAEAAAEVTARDQVVEVRSRRGLGIHEGLTIAVAWDSWTSGAEPEHVIRRPSMARKIAWFLGANWPLLLPVLAFLVMYRVWSASGRDPERRPVAARYEPPDGMTPSEVGVLVDNRPDMRDVTAMIVDLAVRGYLIIEETEEEKLFGLIKEKDYVFELQRDSSQWQNLKRHEVRLLDGMFSGFKGERVPTSDLENSFYKELPGIKKGIFQELMGSRHYRKRPDKVMQRWIGFGVVLAPIIIVPGTFMAAGAGTSPVPVVLAGILSAAVVIGFGIVMPARTISGTRVLEEVLGFEEFLQRVESDRYRRMVTGPEMFERFLPYAMALGVEKTWADAFAGVYTEAPAWYRGTTYHGFHPTSFVGDLSGMTGKATAAMSSSPRSSGGSGFGGGGGGGFSGGGFGGGGGGAF
jgi:hypothetical protein